MRIEPDSADARTDLASLLVEMGRMEQARAELARARAGGADSSDSPFVLGLAAERERRTAQAIVSDRTALEREPGHREAANHLAWRLATSSDPALRDRTQSLRLARRVAARDPDDPFVLDTLAAAQAASGRYPEAVRTQKDALERLARDAAPALRADLERRLRE